MSKIQTVLDIFHESLASNDSHGPLTPYFKETLVDHTVSRSQVDKEIMILDDIILDPFHIKTWESAIKGLIFSSPFKDQFQVEFFLLAQIEIKVDITMQAPAAISMFKNEQLVSAKTPEDIANIINAQLENDSTSQAGYLYINPLVFWQIIGSSLPMDMVPSSTDKDFIKIVDRMFTELMLHEINHHINGHTILNVSSYSPLKKELAVKYKSHTFQLGEFQAESEHALANIIEDYAINEYLDKNLQYDDDIPSIFDQGVSDRNKALDKTTHAISKQSFDKTDLKDIDSSVFERIQIFADSDFDIESTPNPKLPSSSNDLKNYSSLDELIDRLTQKGLSSGDIHSLNENHSEVEQDDASESLRVNIDNAQNETNASPGMQGADYNRTINAIKKTKKLPNFGLKLRKINRLLSKKSHVNWTMPHQILTQRLDLHRIERNPKEPSIHAWIDTSGSMSQEDLTNVVSLIISNYVDSIRDTPIILHTVSYCEVGEPIILQSKKDISKLNNSTLNSNGGTSFEQTLASLPNGRNIIMSDFEWFDGDVSNNIETLSNPNKSILWINTEERDFSSNVTAVIKKLPTSIYLKLTDYTF